jgi:hypothetical protein
LNVSKNNRPIPIRIRTIPTRSGTGVPKPTVDSS